MTETSTYLPDLNLMYSDKMSMAASIELRVPFLDGPLTDFIYSLPPNRKLRGRETKAILRRAMRGIVPDAVIDRRKAPFASPMRRWLRTDLREMVLDHLAPSTLRRTGLFDPAAVGGVVDAYMSGQSNNQHLLYALLHFRLYHDALTGSRAAVTA